jgi:hypothetical protein
MTIGRNRGGDLASQRAAALGISRATWFRRVKQGLIEKPAPPPNEAERHKAWKLRRLERRRAQNAADQTAFARMLETLKLPSTDRLESQTRPPLDGSAERNLGQLMAAQKALLRK